MKYIISFIINLNVILILITTNVYGAERSYVYDFPPLYKFDNYDACLAQEQHNATPPIYAMVFAEIKPNNSSEMFLKIRQHYEEYPYRYRYDRLFFGVCLERCKNLMKTRESYELTKDDFIQNEITDYLKKVHKRPIDIKCRKEYHELIHNCLNHEFEEKYQLNLRTFVEYCEENKNEKEKDEKEEINKDYLESLLYKIVGVIIILNILSTIYDFCLKLQQTEENQTNEFYKINPPQTVSRLLTSFSICRNYYRLCQPYFTEVGKDFQFLDGFRAVCMLLCVFGHIFFTMFQHIGNPEYFEKSSKDENKLWLLNTTAIVETYFVMSGLLLFIKFQQVKFVTPQTSWKKCIVIYFQLMMFRYIRFLPSVALLTLFNATVFTRLQDGPFWRHVTEPIRTFSRDKGWTNVLMINNISAKESASHHTWYIAADWQLFAFYLLVIMIVTKYPKCKKFMYSTLGILSFVIPFSISYFNELAPCFVIKPESYRYTFFKNIDVYFKIYTQSYTNLFGYLIGIICAEIYLKYTRTQEVRKFIYERPLYIAALHLVAIIAALIMWLGPILDIRGPSIWSALYAGLHRNIWMIFVCALPLIFMSCNCGWIAYEFCCLPIFRFLARLSFQVYLWHLTIILLINGYQRQPYYVNNLYFFTQFVITYFTSNILAFFIALFVEYPFAQTLQVLQTKQKSEKIIKKS